MPTYILLSKLTPKGRETLARKPDRVAHVNLEIKDLGFNVKAQWAVIGEYDFISIVEAASNEHIAQLSILLGSRGTMTIQTLSAIPLELLLAKLQGPEHLAHKASTPAQPA